MCSILYTHNHYDNKRMREMILKQLDRGEDSIGIVSHDYRQKRDTSNTIKPAARDNGSRIAVGHLQEFCENRNVGGVIIHMRKPSVGGGGISNAHPLDLGDGLVIVQNGTFKPILEWAKLQLRDFVKEKTDSYYIGKLLKQSMTRRNLLQALPPLKRMSEIGKIGIIFLVNTNTGKALFYSDGHRDCNINIIDNCIEHISNYHPYDNDHNYAVKGHVLFNIEDGSIINKKLEELKVVKYKAPITSWNKSTSGYTSSYKSTYRKSNYTNTYDKEYDDYNKDTPSYIHGIELYDDFNYKPSKNKRKKLIKYFQLTKSAMNTLIEMNGFSDTRLQLLRIRKFVKGYPEYNNAVKTALLNLENETTEYNSYIFLNYFDSPPTESTFDIVVGRLKRSGLILNTK